MPRLRVRRVEEATRARFKAGVPAGVIGTHPKYRLPTRETCDDGRLYRDLVTNGQAAAFLDADEDR